MKKVTEEEIQQWRRFVEDIKKKDRDIASVTEGGISSSALMEMLSFAKIICHGMVMECVEIRCVGSDGTVWNPKNFAAAMREHYKEAKE